MSPYIGGGFGAKLWIRADAVLAALGARAARRPVKVVAAARPHAQQYRPSFGDHPAHPHRRHEGRQDHRHRPRELVRRPARAAAGGRGGADPVAVRGAQPHDGQPAGGARPARAQRDARAQRSARPGGAGNRDRRDGREARHGSGRVPHRQRHAGRAGQSSGQAAIGRSAVQGGRAEAEARSASAVFAAAAGGMPAAGRARASAGTSAARSPAACATGAGSSAWAWPRPIATTWS